MMKTLGTQFQLFKTKILVLFATLLMGFAAQAQFVFSYNTSSPNLCDGYAFIDSSNTMNFTSVLWYMNGTLLQNGGNAIFNLCPGNYTVSTTSSGVTLTSPFTIGTTTPNPCLGFNPTVTVTDCSAPAACDGSIAISCATCAPFSVLWSQGSTTYTIDNLCEGTYAAVVTDSNGCTFNTTQFVGNNGGGNIDSINVIGNLSTGANITGTLISSWNYNCDIELSMLDTAYMVSATFGNVFNQDSLYTVWYLADTTGAYTYINYVFYAPFATGTYNLVLQVYCPIKSTPFYYNIITQFDVQSAGIGSAAPIALTLSPNPVQDILTIQGMNSGNYQIFNAAGQCIQKGYFDNQIEVSQLTNGTYFLNIGTEILPFIKLHQ